MGEPPDLQLPKPTRWPAWAVATSVTLHAVALAALILLYATPPTHPTTGHLIGVLPSGKAPEFRTILVMPPSAVPRPPSDDAAVNTRRDAFRSPSLPPVQPLSATRVALDSLAAWESEDAVRPASWPSFATGLLWDRRPPPPVMVSRTHAERTDSAVKAILDHYLDSLAALPGGGKLLPPTWKANIGGEDYGLDGNYLTVAGLKIPAFVLGLIPLPAGGNESEALDKAGWMRAQDYELAMPREAAAADQREQIRAIRERMAAEQALRRQQQVAPVGKASE